MKKSLSTALLAAAALALPACSGGTATENASDNVIATDTLNVEDAITPVDDNAAGVENVAADDAALNAATDAGATNETAANALVGNGF